MAIVQTSVLFIYELLTILKFQILLIALSVSIVQQPIGTHSGIFIHLSDVQSSNTQSPIDVTLAGIFIDSSALQPLKAVSPIEVTLAGIFIDSSAKQPSKALSHIEVTLSGIVIVSSELHS